MICSDLVSQGGQIESQVTRQAFAVGQRVCVYIMCHYDEFVEPTDWSDKLEV